MKEVEVNCHVCREDVFVPAYYAPVHHQGLEGAKDEPRYEPVPGKECPACGWEWDTFFQFTTKEVDFSGAHKQQPLLCRMDDCYNTVHPQEPHGMCWMHRGER